MCAALLSSTQAGADCPVTLPPDSRSFYGNEYLEAGIPPDGKLVFRPGGPGFVDRDGALGIKVPWNRLTPGRLNVGGRRLDGEAGPARAYIYDYGDTGFQPTYLVFPSPGCWEITGRVGDRTLSFVVLVEKVGEGPSWRFEGIEEGWRVSSSPDLESLR